MPNNFCGKYKGKVHNKKLEKTVLNLKEHMEEVNLSNAKLLDINFIGANLSNAEDTTDRVDILSNGFKLRHITTAINASGGTYIYMAFGQPIVSNSGVCATAR